LDIAVKKYRATAPELAEWPEANIPGGLAVFALPAPHRRRPRTIDMPGRLDKELERRARAATPSPDEASAPRLVSAVAMEISDGWEAGRKYLTTEPD
jgi:transposase-like protein